MAKKVNEKATLVIAGPGAGKTHNMVEAILKNLSVLSPCRYMAVVTHTNSATNNIKDRLSRKIVIPPNLFIGTIHSFLNKFIIIPFSSFGDAGIPPEKLFMQFGVEKVYDQIIKNTPKDKRPKDIKGKNAILAKIRQSMNNSGYITFDQTLVVSRDSMKQKHIAEMVANRIQFLFVDEFQDTGNDVFQILDALRKFEVTKIYCVGDPEQYIQSFDSSIKKFVNIPILKASVASWFEVKMNDSNYRCSEKVIKFINNFNARSFDGKVFQQKRCEKNNVINSQTSPDIVSEDVYFIQGAENVLPIIKGFYEICDRVGISIGNRCLLAKEERVVKRIIAAVGNRYMNPKKGNNNSPVRIIQDTLLYVLGMSSGEFCNHYRKTQHDLRKISVDLFLKIRSEEIKDENEFGIYIHENWELIVKRTLPLKIENLKFDSSGAEIGELVTIANIHTIKGLEQKAVLVIAKTEDELFKWIETDRSKRDEDKEDVCRIGYVAFSRAEQLLCIGCLESLSNECKIALGNLGVKFYISSGHI